MSSLAMASSASSGGPRAGSLVDFPVVRVLLVEDDDDDRELTGELLDEIRDGRRYQLTCTDDYATALAALIEGRHDVCFLDQFLGSWSGLDLLVEATRAGCRVPIVFLTGQSSHGVEQRALAAGAADYLVKGEIDAGALERSIRHSLERARSVDALRTREHQFRSVFEAALDAMVIIDDDARYIDANAAALALYGTTREQLLWKTVGDFAPAEDRARVLTTWAEMQRTGASCGQARICRPDGTERVVEFRAQSNITPGRHLSALRDVTDRVAAEQYRIRLAAIVESAADAIETVSLDGIIEYWSPSAARLYGYAPSEVLGHPKRRLVPDDRIEELEKLFALVRLGESVRDWETVRQRKDGTTFIASVTISPIQQRGQLAAFSIITRDISEKKKIETHLAISDRMASIGTLAAGVAHEINNPLAVVIANLELLGTEIPADATEDAREAFEDARTAADRIRHVVRDLKLFSRPDEERRGAVDLHRLIDSSARMAWNEVRHRAKLVKDYGDIPLVEGSEARLGQVILNLLVNAAQAIREGNVRENEIRLVTRTNARGFVIVEVQDTGAGIAPEHLSRMFEPFFTTKPIGVGTGLGLSICRRIVEELGGTIDVESIVGKGTTFRIAIPAAHADVSPSPVAPDSTRATRRGKVLVIDDDSLILKTVERLLMAEHDVVAAASSADALARLESEAYDVILCDMMMPQMTGMDFFDAVSARRHDHAERIVFVTGGAFTPAAREFLARIPNEVVDKPFDASSLRALIVRRLAAVDAAMRGDA